MFATAETKLWRTASEVNEAMVRVYNHMFMAIVSSGVVSYLVSTSPGLMAFFFTGWMKWVTVFAPLVFVFMVPILLNSGISKIGKILTLHSFAGVMGLSMATIFVVYTMGSIVSAFMGAAILFGTMSLYGYFTKQSLDNIGKWCFVGLIAIVIASIINLFIGSTVAQMMLSALAILIFLGLTAWYTQRIREELSVNTSTAAEVSGALSLYLNFINIFLNLLQLFGSKNE